MTATEKERTQLLILSRADEKTALPVENKKMQVREVVQKEIFPAARNFKW